MPVRPNDNESIMVIIRTRLQHSINKTKKIVFEGKTTSFYRLGDLHGTYVDKYGHVDFNIFYEALDNLKGYLLRPSRNKQESILVLKNNIDKKLIDKILSSKEQKYEIVSSEESGEVFEEYNTKLNSDNNNNKTSNIDSRNVSFDNNSLVSNNSLNNNNSVNNTTPATKSDYYDNMLGSSEDEIEMPSKKFKSPLTQQPVTNIISNNTEQFSSIKQKIIDSFDGAMVIPVSSFNIAMSQKHGSSINYKTAPCKIPKHKHANLSKYLACCRDFIEIKNFRGNYIFLSTNLIREQMKKRKLAFLVSKKDPRFWLYFEALCTAICPIKVTIPVDDFCELFRLVYNIKIDQVCGMAPLAALNKILSLNIRVLNNNGIYSVVVTPLQAISLDNFDKTSADIFKDILKINDGIINGYQITNASVDVVIKSREAFFISDSENNSFEKLLKIADFNIPKSLQHICAEEIDLEFSLLWKYLKSNINFDDKNTFYF